MIPQSKNSPSSVVSRLADMSLPCAILGEVGTQLHCVDVMLLARTYGDLISPDGDGMFAIAHDTRPSSASLAEIVSVGLRSGGHHVTHLGNCTTPCLEWSITELDFLGGIMITGGDAPATCNGLRFYRRQAQPVPIAAIIKVATEWTLSNLLSTECNQTLRHRPMLAEYAAFIRRSIRSVPMMKLVIDAGHGLIGMEAESIFSHLHGFRIWPVGFKPELKLGTHGQNLFEPKRLRKLASLVTQNGCNFGAAFDPSGERLAVVDETGTPVSPESLGWMFAHHQMERHPNLKILHDPACSPSERISAQPISASSCKIWEALHHTQSASLYFDNSGRYAFPETPGLANALFALMMIINRLNVMQMPLSEALDNQSG